MTARLRLLGTSWLVAATIVLLATPAWAQSSLPNPGITPGATNPDVTPQTMRQTICRRGWTKTIRPPEEYTYELKRRGISQYGYASRQPSDYEEDHLIPLGLGGHPTAPENLWPEPRQSPDGWTAEMKDDLESTLNHLVCRRRVALSTAQNAFATNWEQAYRQYVPQHQKSRREHDRY